MWKFPFFVIVSSFSILGFSSYASSLSQPNGTAQVSSTAPSPGSGFGLGGGGKSVDKPRDDVTMNPKGSDVRDECSTASDVCRDGNKLSACLVHSGAGSKEAFLVVQNGGEISLAVKVLYAPANISAQEIVLGKHRTEKIPYATSMNPLRGVYLLFGMALIVVGIWACCRSGKSERQVDAIPYQELEMGNTDVISANDEETPEGWDDDWDNDWDEIKEDKPSGGKVAGNPSSNGMASKSGAATARNGWEDNWDD